MEDTNPVFRSDSRLGCGWGRERGIWSKRKERTCIYEIFTMCEALCVLYIFLLLILTSVYWVDIIIPDILMRTWRLNNISKIEQWWSWSLKIGLSDFKSLVFPYVPLDPKTGLFLLGFCKLPFPLLPKHQFSLISSESPVTFHPLLHLLSPPTVNSFVPPAPIWGPISPFRLSTLCSTCSLASLDPKLTWIFNYATKGYLRLASPLVQSNTRTPLW